jgi:hypothetical protein
MNGFEYTGIAVMIFVAGVMFPYFGWKLVDAAIYVWLAVSACLTLRGVTMAAEIETLKMQVEHANLIRRQLEQDLEKNSHVRDAMTNASEAINIRNEVRLCDLTAWRNVWYARAKDSAKQVRDLQKSLEDTRENRDAQEQRANKAVFVAGELNQKFHAREQERLEKIKVKNADIIEYQQLLLDARQKGILQAKVIRTIRHDKETLRNRVKELEKENLTLNEMRPLFQDIGGPKPRNPYNQKR